MTIKVINIKKGLIFNKISFKASSNESICCVTALGDKKFWINSNEVITKLAFKTNIWHIGDSISLSNLINSVNQFKFSWKWV
jgi:hypothetical protein